MVDFAVNPQVTSRLTLLIFRGGSAAKMRKTWSLPLWRFADLIWTRTLVGAELPFSVVAGPRLRLPPPNTVESHPRRYAS
jgi:hypothetical protein